MKGRDLPGGKIAARLRICTGKSKGTKRSNDRTLARRSKRDHHWRMKLYICQRCTNCCRWPGFVKVTDADIAEIAAFLGVEEEAFVEEFTRLRPLRDGLALTDQPDGACIFLDGCGCRIQQVKPDQCRGFPNTWKFPGWREVCGAIEADAPVSRP